MGFARWSIGNGSGAALSLARAAAQWTTFRPAQVSIVVTSFPNSKYRANSSAHADAWNRTATFGSEYPRSSWSHNDQREQANGVRRAKLRWRCAMEAYCQWTNRLTARQHERGDLCGDDLRYSICFPRE